MTIAYCPFYKPLFTDTLYKKLSNDAKILYTAMRDRDDLSKQNDWKDENGRFILMSRKTMAEFLNRSLPTIRKIIRELVVVGLLTEKRRGLTQCNHIYVQPMKQENEKNLPPERKTIFPSEGKDVYLSDGKPAFLPDGNQVSPNNLDTKVTDVNQTDNKGNPVKTGGKNTKKPGWRKPKLDPKPQSAQQTGYPPQKPWYKKTVPAQQYTQRDYAPGALQAMLEENCYRELYGDDAPVAKKRQTDAAV
jgi:hypothetical protein